MKKINIAELLKDCPSGMELDCTMFEGLEFDSIVDNLYLPIRCRILNPDGNGYNIYNFTKYGCWNTVESAKCVIFPKGKTTWEGFQRPFKDGDVLCDDRDKYKFICIYKEYDAKNRQVHSYCGLDIYGEFMLSFDNWTIISGLRLATEEEKQKLFKAIKDNGYKWNDESKTLEKLIEPKFKVGDIIQDIDTYKVKITEVNIEDECYGYESMILKGIGGISFSEQDNWKLVPNKFDITTLKAFESRVLVRDYNTHIWEPVFWGKLLDKKNPNLRYLTTNGCFKYCIPYENNQHLLGTTNDCDEYFKTWEE